MSSGGHFGKWPLRLSEGDGAPTIIEQLDCNKLLGVLFQSNFKMDMHVQNILTQCTQRMYLIKLLKHQGMPQQQLSVITYSIIVSRILGEAS